MKRNIIIALLLLLSIGISTVLLAQSPAKKKKKHHHHKTKAVDSAAAVVPAPDTAKPLASTPAPPDGILDTAHDNFLVADSTVPPYAAYPIDSTKPVDGMYKIPVLR